MKPVAIVRALFRADATLLGLLGARIYQSGEVPQGANRPFAVLSVTGNAKDQNLEDVSDYVQRIASVNVDVVGDHDGQIQPILDRIPAAFDGKSGTVADCEVFATESDDFTGSSNGPIDLDDGQAFVGSCTCNLAYK